MTQKICIIADKPEYLDIQGLLNLKTKGSDLKLYTNGNNFKRSCLNLSEFQICETESSSLNQQLATDFINHPTRTIFLFADETKNNNINFNQSACFNVINFCPFNFLTAYRYATEQEIKQSSGSPGYLKTTEKRIFNPGEAPPSVSLLYGLIPVISNQSTPTSSILFNQRYSSEAITERASKLLSDALSTTSLNNNDYLDLTLHHLQQRSFSQSAWSLNKAISNMEDCPLAKFIEVNVALQTKDPAQLEKLRLQLSEKYLHQFPEAAFLLSEIAYISGYKPEAKQILQKLLQKIPEYPAALLRLSSILMEGKEYQQALDYTGKCLQIDPYNSESLLNYSQLMIMARRFEPALSAIKKAQISPSCDSRVFLQLASVDKHSGNIAGAVNNLQKYVDIQDCNQLKDSRLAQAIAEIKKEIIKLKSGK